LSDSSQPFPHGVSELSLFRLDLVFQEFKGPHKEEARNRAEPSAKKLACFILEKSSFSPHSI
jgi:hypothetical protein